MATVIPTESAKAQIDALDGFMKNKVLNVIDRLAKWPTVSGAKPLKYDLKGFFRIRVRDYRVMFHVVGDTVWIDSIDNRKDVYDG